MEANKMQWPRWIILWKPSIRAGLDSRRRGKPSRSGQHQKSSLWRPEVFVTGDMNRCYREAELNSTVASSTRRKWFSINACDLMFEVMRGIVQNVIDTGRWDCLPW